MKPQIAYCDASPAEQRIAICLGEDTAIGFYFQRPDLVSSNINRLVTAKVKSFERNLMILDIGGDIAVANRDKNATIGSKILMTVRADRYQRKNIRLKSPSVYSRALVNDLTIENKTAKKRKYNSDKLNNLQSILENNGFENYSVRLQAEYYSETQLLQEAKTLNEYSLDILQKHNQAKSPTYHDSALNIYQQLLLNLPPQSTIQCATPHEATVIQQYAKNIAPDLITNISWNHKNPFIKAQCDVQLDEALQQTYNTNCGAKLHFCETETLTAIDCDSASAKLHPLEISKRITTELGQQIMARNIQGLIVFDALKTNGMSRIIPAIKKSLKYDNRPFDVLGLTAGGLIEITRQRQQQSLKEFIYDENNVLKPGADIAKQFRNMLINYKQEPIFYGANSLIKYTKEKFNGAITEVETSLQKNIQWKEIL